MGVFWGFLIAWTPTIGLQTGLYLTVTTLARANRLSGLPIIMISNPVTAVPIFYANWWVGSWVLHGGHVDYAAGQRFVDAQIHAWRGEAGEGSLVDRLLTWDFWAELGASLLEVGAELWLGSLLVGAVVGLVAYAVTRRAIAVYRRRRRQRVVGQHAGG
jgi:hypothetical protein